MSRDNLTGYADGNALGCVVCESTDTFVKETRRHKGTYRRRRECKDCGERFWTVEIVADFHCRPDAEQIQELSR